MAQELHFGHAAKRLRVAQPAVSRDIRALEQMLGLTFFLRSTRHVEMTETGKRFYDRLADPLIQIDHALQLAKQEAKGSAGALRISYMDFAIDGPMFRIVRQFRGRYPNVDVELLDCHTDMQVDWLTDMRVEAGFLLGPVAASNLMTHQISAERLMAVLPADHRLAGAEHVQLSDLAKEPFVLGNHKYWRTFRRLIDNACLGAGFSPNVIQEASTTDAIFGLVKVGMGLTLYVEGRSKVGMPGLVFKPLAEPAPSVTTILAWNPKNKSAILPRFLDMAKSFEAATAEQAA